MVHSLALIVLLSFTLLRKEPLPSARVENVVGAAPAADDSVAENVENPSAPAQPKLESNIVPAKMAQLSAEVPAQKDSVKEGVSEMEMKQIIKDGIAAVDYFYI